MRRVSLLVLVCAILASAGWSCPVINVSVAEMIRGSSGIVLARISRIHDVDGVPVAELEVLQQLKGEIGGGRAFLPVEMALTLDGDERVVGEVAVAFLTPSDDYRGTRRFWRAVDRLRDGAPLMDVVMWGWLPFGSDGVRLHASVSLPDEPAVVGDPAAPPWRFVDLDTIAKLVAEEASRPAPGAENEADLPAESVLTPR